MEEKEKLRLDKFLWSIRLFKTRALATEACEKGKVRFNGSQAKPSKKVHIGEEYEVKTEAKKWVIRVLGPLHNRVQYSEAIKFYADLTPEEEVQRASFQAESFHTGKRLSKIGRPSKKQRRNWDGLVNGEE
jgi:ribosome-associated heat shock protein Hsp15